MICHKDMTFYTRDCWNMECKRNAKHVPEGVLEPICMAEFMNCEKYEGIIELESKDYEVVQDEEET